ncbi:hypothetical protein M1328_05290 [Patescibacteria group bacterium]|nr:hypothetical protein [Patescibacteria group bacterium]
MEKDLASVFHYFAVFDYFPDFPTVYTFFPRRISRKQLKKLYEARKYTVGEYSKQITNNKYQISKKKLQSLRFRLYVKLISLFPQIKLVGLSGSISMMNAKENDDIDLFIITTKNRLFTGRFVALVLAQILGLRRHRELQKFDTAFFDRHTPMGPLAIVSKRVSSLLYKDKVCLNLFFDERELNVPEFKQTVFVGHEVLQMKPLINKSHTYEKFLSANQWVLSFFPNAAKISNFKFLISKFKNYKLNKNLELKNKNFSDWIENSLKKLQLKLITRHRTTELITSTQLWFHPDDFEKTIKRKLR